MPDYVAQRKTKRVSIGRMSHRVVLCTAHDVIDESGALRLTREGVATVKAAIEPRRSSLFSRDGQPVKEERDQQSHVVTIRTSTYLISAAAWIYEARGHMPPRWFKVLGVREIEEQGSRGRFWELSTREVQRGDAISRPAAAAPGASPAVTPVVPLPNGVRL